MPILFPDYQREIYAVNPLRVVTVQLRFPAVLRIDSQPPSEFQELIRDQYPVYQEHKSEPLEGFLPQEVARALPDLAMPLRFNARHLVHEFLSEDESWAVSLTRESLGLRSTAYERRETFKGHLEGPFKALAAVYGPSFVSRIGLRYENMIQKSALLLPEDTPWGQLLREPVASELSDDDVSAAIRERVSRTTFQLGTVGYVRLQHGLAMMADESKEVVYMLDMDLFSDVRRGLNDVGHVLDQFHDEAACIFRWCIQDKLHDALRPMAL